MNLYRHRGRIYSLLRAFGYADTRIGPGGCAYHVPVHKTKMAVGPRGKSRKWKQCTYMDIDHENYSEDPYCYSRGKSFAKFLREYRQCL